MNTRIPKLLGLVAVTILFLMAGCAADDLRRDGDSYVNDAYSRSDVTLRINIEGAVGTVNLELGD